MIIICLYRTPESDANILINQIDAILHKLCQSNKKIILVGDFNINVIEDSKDIDKPELLDIIKSYNMTLHSYEPTRQKNCIDLVISNVQTAEEELLHLALSDHNTAQMLNVPILPQKVKQSLITSIKEMTA